MMALPVRSWPAIAAVAAVQSMVLAYMVLDRMSLLARGREIVAEVTPVDPRDIFRGDHVILNYTFSRTANIPVPDSIRAGNTLFVMLKPATEPRRWEVVSVHESYPRELPPENVVLEGRVTYVGPKTETRAATVGIRYGIERYFVPEGTGEKLEQLVREKKINAVIAVGPKGEAAIKALEIEGKRLVEEPLL